MKKLFSGIFIILFVWSTSTLYAQHCGTTEASQYEMREQMFENRAKREAALQNGIANPRGGATQYVPVQFHLVGKTDKTSVANESQVLSLMCNLNSNYEDQDIVFYIKHPHKYIYNTSTFNDPDAGNSTAQFHMLNSKVNNAINVFITGSAGAGSAGFYQPPFPQLDYLVIQKQSMTDNTATHEFGHFFSLAHPFVGWGQAGDSGWDPAVHGMQVGNNAPDGSPNEKMDMSNCAATADGICDTPPDYLFALSPIHDSDCTWEGGALDPDGTLVVTKENNFMNYFFTCGSYSFTDDQKTEIWSNLTESSQRAYIRHNYVPGTEQVTEIPELIYPISGESTPGFNLIEFDWETVTGATHYILEIDFLPTYALSTRYTVSNGSSKEVEGIFEAGKTYYWRVRAYSEGNTCGSTISASGTFKAGDSVNTKDIEQVNDWAIIPNPVSLSNQLTIQMETSEAFEAVISLYSMTGQQLKNVQNHLFTQGSNSYTLDINGLTPGIYVVAINSATGVVNKKVVITK